MGLKLQVAWDGETAYKLFKVTGSAGSPTYTEITLPGGLTLTKRRPCFLEYFDSYVLITNFWEEPVAVYDDGTTVGAWTAGLAAPSATGRSLTQGGAGSLDATLTAAYISVAHQTPDGVKLAESNLSGNILTTNLTVGPNGSVTFGGLPTTSPDGRSNRLYGYLEVEGFLPRRVFNVAFGSATQNVTLSAAAIAALPVAPNNGLSPSVQARTTPPETRYCFSYHRRVFYAMNDVYPYRVWYSLQDEPESVDPNSYFDTLGKETITGLGLWSDTLMVFGRRSKYALQGWSSGRDGTPSDMSFRKVHPSIGTVCHHSILEINGKLYYMAEDGLRLWNGSTRWLGAKAEGEEAFRANPASFYTGIAINDSQQQCYIFQPYLPGNNSLAYVYYYAPADPDLGGSDAEMPFEFDQRFRVDTTRMSWREDDGTVIQLTGSDDGYVRRENVATNVNDDADSYAKRWTVVPKHQFFAVPGGGLFYEGKYFDRIWLHMNAQTATVEFSVYAGDERAYELAYTATRADTLTDPITATVRDGYTYNSMPLSVWEYKPDVAGRGITTKLSIASPPQTSVWYGYSTFWRPGASGRFARSRTAV